MKQDMPKKQKRDNAYYEERLKNEFPTIYADLKAGRHRNVAEAAIAAGLKKPRTRLNKLKNAFDKASKAEQADFLSWLQAGICGRSYRWPYQHFRGSARDRQTPRSGCQEADWRDHQEAWARHG